MSGGIVGNFIMWPSTEEQLTAAERFSELFNCQIKPVNKMIDCLRGIPANEIYSKYKVPMVSKDTIISIRIVI